jgi:glucokinase
MNQTTSQQTTTQNQSSFMPILVADIGGTNARFAVATQFDFEANTFVIEHLAIFPSANFTSFESALSLYLSQLAITKPAASIPNEFRLGVQCRASKS